MPPKKRGAAAATAKTSTKTTTATAASAATTTAVAPKRPRRGAAVAASAAVTASLSNLTDPTVTETDNTVKTQADEKEKITKENVASKLREADKNTVRTHLPDKTIPSASNYSVYADYDCMLNQTNIGHNNNKFYVIQVLESHGSYYCWNRWGRVGELGMNNGLECYGSDVNGAIKSFEKKFNDKTKNKWADRAKFVPVTGKYTLIEMDASNNPEEETTSHKVESSTPKDTRKSRLDPATQDLMTLLFDRDMFKSALANFDIDVKKMPLGKLSKSQIAKGFEVLEEIEAAIKMPKRNNQLINDLSSKFYTVIPQDFGRQRPPPIADEETLQKKYDMLIVLSDIELTQSMQESKEKELEKAKDEEDEKNKPPNPLDVKYDMLNCELELVDKKSDEFKILQTYTNQTAGWHRNLEILDVWKVKRQEEVKRFAKHDSIENRKLLWHGTNVAVVAAILKTGLRIMPHSGGRVGRGIYFASENGKSAGYVCTTNYKGKNIGIMFLNEVALGNEHLIYRDDSSLTQAPKGYDCIIAKGITEPDPKADISLDFDGKKVIIPQGKPISTKVSSSFSQSEYLVYNESQNRIRYLLKMKF